MGRVSWVTRVMGQLSDGSRWSRVTKYDPLSAPPWRTIRYDDDVADTSLLLPSDETRRDVTRQRSSRHSVRAVPSRPAGACSGEVEDLRSRRE